MTTKRVALSAFLSSSFGRLDKTHYLCRRKQTYYDMNPFTKRIAQVLGLPEKGVDNTLALLEDGCTIPFISRYRKERTGGLDEVQITRIADMNDKLKELVKPH